MRTQHPSHPQPGQSDRDVEIGCLQLDWLHARAPKVYFELLDERYNPKPNCFDWSINVSPDQYKSLKHYQKGRRKKVIPYSQIRSARRNRWQLPRLIAANEPLASAAIS